MNGSARTLGFGSTTAVAIGAMIGTGVFTSSGLLLADLGSPHLVLAAWVVGGLVAALGAICYGALARRIPESGGEYLFLSHTLHPAAGYLAGWVTLLVGFSAPLAAAALAFAEYARIFLPQGVPAQVTGSTLLVVAAAVHATSLSRAARVQALAVAVEVVLIIGFISLGAGRLDPLPLSATGHPEAFAVALIWISYSYSGWNTVAYIGGEVKDPEHNLPRAMLAGTAVVTALYLALNAVFLFATPPTALVGRLDVGRIAAEAIGGPYLATAASALIAFVLAIHVSAMTMAGPHVCARMAADGYLPRALAASTGRPPRAALAAQLVVAMALAWTAAYDRLLTYVGFTLALSTAATVAGLVRLRRREGPALPVWGWPYVPGLFLTFVLGTAAFTVARRPLESLIGLGTLGLGGLAFRGQRRPA